MSQKDFLQTKEAVGTHVWHIESGFGIVIEMSYSSTYSMGTGVRWADEKTVDQYIGNDGIWPGELLTNEELCKLVEQHTAFAVALDKISTPSIEPSCMLAIKRAQIARETLDKAVQA